MPHLGLSGSALSASSSLGWRPSGSALWLVAPRHQRSCAPATLPAAMAPSPGHAVVRLLTSLCALLLLGFASLSVPCLVSFHEPVEATQEPQALPMLGRRQRRRLTALLNSFVPTRAEVVWDPLLGLKGALPEATWKRRRGMLFEAQRRHWRCRGRWAGWPSRGVRFGEASLPGPDGSPSWARAPSTQQPCLLPGPMLPLLRCVFPGVGQP